MCEHRGSVGDEVGGKRRGEARLASSSVQKDGTWWGTMKQGMCTDLQDAPADVCAPSTKSGAPTTTVSVQSTGSRCSMIRIDLKEEDAETHEERRVVQISVAQGECGASDK